MKLATFERHFGDILSDILPFTYFLCILLQKLHHFVILFLTCKKENDMTNKKRFTITMSESVHAYLEELCKEKGLSKSAMITVVLEEYKKGQK